MNLIPIYRFTKNSVWKYSGPYGEFEFIVVGMYSIDGVIPVKTMESAHLWFANRNDIRLTRKANGSFHHSDISRHVTNISPGECLYFIQNGDGEFFRKYDRKGVWGSEDRAKKYATETAANRERNSYWAVAVLGGSASSSVVRYEPTDDSFTRLNYHPWLLKAHRIVREMKRQDYVNGRFWDAARSYPINSLSKSLDNYFSEFPYRYFMEISDDSMFVVEKPLRSKQIGDTYAANLSVPMACHHFFLFRRLEDALSYKMKSTRNCKVIDLD